VNSLLGQVTTYSEGFRSNECFRAKPVEVFNNNEALADSVNHLLVVGFYLINFGYVSLALKMSQYPENAAQGIESLSWKIGLVLLVLGGMHFVNLLIFQRIHRRPKLRNYPPVPRAESVVS